MLIRAYPGFASVSQSHTGESGVNMVGIDQDHGDLGPMVVCERFW